MGSSLAEVFGGSEISFWLSRGEHTIRVDVKVRKRATVVPAMDRNVYLMNNDGMVFLQAQMTGFVVMLEDEELEHRLIGDILVNVGVYAGENVTVVVEEEKTVVGRGELRLVEGLVRVYGLVLIVNYSFLVMHGVVVKY